ncbi:MAG TPA: cytochrome c oxidase subunit II [Candidatus Competibacteraceae bacterium]|nr:cytochrome c oxidase subunit II [Candidatus Competibacteraceae bacterium]
MPLICRARTRAPIIAAGLLGWSATASAEFGLNMSPGVTAVSREVYDLHMLIFWICVWIGIGVFGVMFYSIYHHRKSKGAVAAQFHESTTIELLWTVIPMLILISMAIPATRALIAMEDTSEPELTVVVTGYQWKWKYDYLDQGVSFYSTLSTPREQIYNVADKGQHYLLEVDNPLVLPVSKKVRILTTAADVIHSWWVPDLGWKRDAIPGFVNESWTRIDTPGVYRGQCAELCGKDHGFMPIVVVAKSEADFQQWLQEQKSAKSAAATAAGRDWSRDELLAKGQQVYGQHCAACHQPNGQGIPGAFPAIAGSPVAKGPVAEHIKTVLDGRPGTAMQAFKHQLSDIELAAVITYQRNAWGNDTGDAVQPRTVQAQR